MLMDIIKFIVFQLLSQPSILLGIVALIGLILQKRPANQVVMGTLKTIIGVVIIGAGASVISGSLSPLGTIMNHSFNIKGIMPTNEAVLPFALKNFGTMGALVMVGGFIVNIILARISRFKFIYLTGHIMFYVSLFVTAIYVSVANLSGIVLFLVGSLTMGLYFTFMPALLYPYTSKITNGEKFTVGHTGDVAYWFSAWIGKFVGKPEDSAEKFKLPKSLSFFRDSTAGMAVTMMIIFIIAVVMSGYTYISKNISGDTNPLIYAIMQGLTFAAGVTIVLSGVRMMLSEIIPAFTGISEKVVPGAIPALDCPVMFPYAPTALVFGFISMFVGMIIGMFVQLGLGAFYIILPGIVPAFFAGGTAGIFGNSTGGWKGAIVGPFIMGIVLAVGTGYLIPNTGALASTGSTFGDPFYATVGLGFAKWVKEMTVSPIVGTIILLLVVAVLYALGRSRNKQVNNI
ncbi:PTS ascorbate transporter subunit IIC [Thermoanaerobacterium butyriciformans]|uniref:Ascorbate-specific PTS system EIIC component n=1 Tax=Thermoanaerobacterium butyriciformans TaxID=1702242 RepID=A0ABS4NFJ9_9THEO|nr:PTS ascorbate transporter subunit IIC [Thermoanaerobacterium butyriciformans]MBP2072431.1 PTS system ascorbate-specific IIC component [Thermoanaerobacterium butyriciformans]